MKYTILKNEDIEQYLSIYEKMQLRLILTRIDARRALEKKNENEYVLIHVDEPYEGQVIDIIQTHHGQGETG
ncbi:hypothetical protein B7C51_04890 [Paenibacillus larvae subsp. pulvifaciens]|uniref:Uncharacterized protein n=1 Tax=Paenibacillus larvae subsp. pulvifaciens TaxID=1477 RepID=A0A1V0UQB9_9BACL|nr:hypothetical protein [Paenibacillus larvae]ARF67306.1 hypothetical protein B7C51_04890 [Paenibacillus larvae subsp. pulvifaciens]